MAYTNPIILYDNILETYGINSVTSEASGFPKENIYDWLDWTYWKATSGGTQEITIDKGSSGTSVDTLAVLGHNFGTGANSLSCDVTVYEYASGGSPLVELGSTTITDDDPVYLNLTAGDERYNEIKIENMEDPAYAAVIFLGAKMTMPVSPEFNFDPDRQRIYTEKFVSYSGRMISSALKYTQRDMSVQFKRIPQTWVASDLLPFLEDHYAAMKPFFFIPDPGDHFGNDKIFYLVAPDNPNIRLPVHKEDINYRNWILSARGVRQSTF